MSYPLPRVNQHQLNDHSGLFNVAKSYSPTGEDLLLLGNTIVSSTKRGKSPASYGGSPHQLNAIISAPNLAGSPYTPRQDFDQNGMPLQGSPGLLGYPGARQGYGGSRGYDLLGMGGMNSRSRNSIGSPMSPYGNMDYIPQGMGFPDLGMQSPYGQPGYPRGPNGEEVAPVVKNYFNKQNEIMAKILQDVEEFKRLELVKERMMYDQHFSRMDLSGNGMVSPYGQNMTSLHAFPTMIPAQPLLMSQSQSPDQKRSQNPYDPDGPPIPPIGLSRRDVSFDNEGNSKTPPRKTDSAKLDPIKPLLNKKATLKKANRIRARRNIKAIGWSLALPGLWFMSTVRWAKKRRAQELKSLEELIPDHLEKFLEFGADVIEKEIKALALDKNSMVIVVPPKTSLKREELDKRCKTITDHLISILDNLSLKLDSGKLSKEFFEFLATVSENDAIIPEGFLSGFEIDRLSFNLLGNLKSMNEGRSKMILGSYVLVKGLLYFMIMRSWTVISSIPEKNVNMKNMINVGSILYNIILEVFFETVPEIQGAETVPPFKAKKTTFVAVEPGNLNKLDVIPEDNDNDSLHIVAGFYERERLLAFLDDRPLMVKEVKEAVIDFLDVLYELTHAVYKPKTHVKKLFKDHRPK